MRRPTTKFQSKQKTSEVPTPEDIDRFFEALQQNASVHTFPKLRASFCSVAVLDQEPNVKVCLEIGASLLFDKPLILIVQRGQFMVPPNLRRIASSIIEVDNLDDPNDREKVQVALQACMKEVRAKEQIT